MQIERDIPMPTVARTAAAKYPFRNMSLGDSFRINGDNEARKRVICAAASYRKSSHGKGKSFATRRDGDGFRVWRTA
ncbi:hypothetical protein [Stenotrophomonas maltophilia]|uniref:hypothetical protein n=1 Tax=Stenotrophomonas maltophilia TaxID=40324 RepID=UPI002B1E2369|nr:hypothetical protein [Stenotrophomonas maltophilia]